MRGTGSTPYQYLPVGDEADVVTPTRPGLVVERGGTDIDESFEWMIERSGGGDFLVLRTSGTDAYNDDDYATRGASGVRPDSAATLIVRTREAASDPSSSGRSATPRRSGSPGGTRPGTSPAGAGRRSRPPSMS